MRRLVVVGNVDSPGQGLLMPLGGHGIASCGQFRQEERPVAVGVKYARALCVRHDDMHIGRIFRTRCVFDGKFKRQRILRGGCLERLRFLLPDAATDIGHCALGLLWRQRVREGSEHQRSHNKTEGNYPSCDKRCAFQL